MNEEEKQKLMKYIAGEIVKASHLKQVADQAERDGAKGVAMTPQELASIATNFGNVCLTFAYKIGIGEEELMEMCRKHEKVAIASNLATMLMLQGEPRNQIREAVREHVSDDEQIDEIMDAASSISEHIKEAHPEMVDDARQRFGQLYSETTAASGITKH